MLYCYLKTTKIKPLIMLLSRKHVLITFLMVNPVIVTSLKPFENCNYKTHMEHPLYRHFFFLFIYCPVHYISTTTAVKNR